MSDNIPINIPTFLYKITWGLSIILLVLIIYYLINIGNNYIPDKNKIKMNYKWIIPILFVFVAIIVMYSLFKKYTILSDTFYTIILSLMLAYLFNPIINYLEKRNIKRIWGVLLVYLGIVGIIFILAFLVIPKSSKEIKRFMVDMPNYIEKASSIIDLIYNEYYSTIGELPPIFEGVQQIVMENIVALESIVVNGLKTFIGGIINIFSKVVSLVLTPIVTLYLLVDKNYFKEKIINLIPLKYRNDFMELFKDIDYSLSKFVRGRIIMAIYVGVTTSIMLLILRIDFAIAIGFITGFADVIPYIGPFLGFLPAVFFAFISSPIKALWISIIFIIIQWTENNILAPKVIGSTTGMHPMVILLSIIIGGGVFGVFGMILSVPSVAIFIILYNFIKDKMKSNGFPKE